MSVLQYSIMERNAIQTSSARPLILPLVKCVFYFSQSMWTPTIMSPGPAMSCSSGFAKVVKQISPSYYWGCSPAPTSAGTSTSYLEEGPVGTPRVVMLKMNACALIAGRVLPTLSGRPGFF